VRFIVDAQLPPALARWLSAQGHESTHVFDHQLATARDAEIWDFALATQAVLISKDEDFAQRRNRSEDGPVIIWIRLGNTRSGPLIRWFERLLPDVLEAIDRGETLMEVR
jgi:predicted nuclease of predicted toxin-antitoxin system